MRKHFAKPALSRFEIRLNENIALSWEYYYKKGTLTNTYHFTHVVGSNPAPDAGCYDYYMGKLEPAPPSQGWSTTLDYEYWFTNINKDYTNMNSVNAMTSWLAWVNEFENASVCFDD